MQIEKPTLKERIQDVDSMFQFVIMISIFFLSFMDNLFKLAQEAEIQSATVQMNWTTALIGLVTGYILFRISRFRLKEWVIKVTNWVLFAEVISIILAIIVVLKYGNNITSYIGFYTLKLSLWIATGLSILVPIWILAGIFILNKVNLKAFTNRPRSDK